MSARMIRTMMVTALLLAGACGPEPQLLRVMTWNVGNADGTLPNYPLRLSDQRYEDYVAAQIRAQAPDVVFLQEVLAPNLCGAFTETDPGRTCYDAANRPPPIRRLLGDDYSVICDARLQVECIGVRRAAGTIDGVPEGGLALMGAETPPLPLPPCAYTEGGCDDTKCDAEATVTAATMRAGDSAIRLVHAHPNAAGTNNSGAYIGEPCRYAQLEQLFNGLVREGPQLLAGDWNTDSAISATAREKELWTQHVGPTARYQDLSALDETGHYYATRRVGPPVVLDRVLAEGFTGTCTVHGKNRFGTDPGTQPLDAGFDFSGLPMGAEYPGRIDHFAVVCDVVR